MEINEFKLMVDMFLDGELDKNRESKLFERLSFDEECRNYFRQVNKLKNIVCDEVEEFPVELEERIMYSVGNIEDKKQKSFFNNRIFTLVAYSFALILLFVTFHFYTLSARYQDEIKSTVQQVNRQEELLKVLMNNSLQEIRVEDTKLTKTSL